MKIIIDDKVCDVEFFGFFKGYVLSWLLSMAIVFGFFFIIGVLIA